MAGHRRRSDRLPLMQGENITIISGGLLNDHLAQKVACDNSQLVAKTVPVYFMKMKIAGQGQMVAGVDKEDFCCLARGGKLLEGHAFSRSRSDWDGYVKGLVERRTAGMTEEQKQSYILDITASDLAEGGWMEMIIDQRLARAGKIKVGDVVKIEPQQWQWHVVGVAPAGVSSRAFVPRCTAQCLFGSNDMMRSTLAVKLRGGAAGDEAIGAFRRAGLDAIPVSSYRDMLQQTFGVMFRYVDAVNVIALVIAFLFVMVTLYMMVLQRTREIAILKVAARRRLSYCGRFWRNREYLRCRRVHRRGLELCDGLGDRGVPAPADGDDNLEMDSDSCRRGVSSAHSHRLIPRVAGEQGGYDRGAEPGVTVRKAWGVERKAWRNRETGYRRP